LPPALFEDANLRLVEEPDHGVHGRNQLGRAQRPTAPEHDVVYASCEPILK